MGARVGHDLRPIGMGTQGGQVLTDHGGESGRVTIQTDTQSARPRVLCRGTDEGGNASLTKRQQVAERRDVRFGLDCVWEGQQASDHFLPSLRRDQALLQVCLDRG